MKEGAYQMCNRASHCLGQIDSGWRSWWWSKRMLNSWRGSWFYMMSISHEHRPIRRMLDLKCIEVRSSVEVLYSSVRSHWSLWRAVKPHVQLSRTVAAVTAMYGYDFCNYADVHQGRSWPRENHIDANSIGLRLAIDTCSPAVYIRYICAALPKISKVGGGYL